MIVIVVVAGYMAPSCDEDPRGTTGRASEEQLE